MRDELRRAVQEIRSRPAYAADIVEPLYLILADMLIDQADIQTWMTEAQLGDEP